MLEKTVSGWKLKESQEGLTVVHPLCVWKSTPYPQAVDILRNYIIRGMFEDEGSLIFALVKDGQFKLMKITVSEDAALLISIMEITSTCSRLILKGFCNLD